ncbi:MULTISPECIES: bis(5'-nucleosyl)-tetraphosphatase (symmetrical) YqeK [Anaerococcus]|uniref:bis(5'-nucleosyl)-tetraphosphatase (symmetrical) YqeK n=1 Tax=Anaerococcus TaxID=165779 RepID=UPI0029024E8E|nr:bis(5'-nucleosyl)-tetraphosphatase (symmetrical) YqeK [Anaerococcus sp.]MDU1828646.1 bis(5'-nucleosyl)-tetraphosphatase (symmetrical) YqeK [Anaerococcus sp.]MDU1863939.1 bis(5'-nucleosyl)-tetraphosphatase (symmetrical) YqeK [Anaerococcus sp.]
MYDLENWKEQLLSDIGDKRFKHSMRVMETSIELNKKYNIDEDKLKTAAILHDCAKYNEDKYYNLYGKNLESYQKEFKQVLHSFLGAEVARLVYNIKDEEVLDAIRFHTTAKENMSDFEKIIYLADAIEPKRDYPGVDKIRSLAKKDLDQAMLYSLDHNIEFIISRKALIHPLTIDARNFLIKEKNE